MGKPSPIDETLAFTALLELDPDFGKLTMAEAATMRDRLQNDFYASDATNLFEYAKGWVQVDHIDREFLAEREAANRSAEVVPFQELPRVPRVDGQRQRQPG